MYSSIIDPRADDRGCKAGYRRLLGTLHGRAAMYARRHFHSLAEVVSWCEGGKRRRWRGEAEMGKGWWRSEGTKG